MIDIHNHILCGVDDGCVNYEETLQILKNAQDEGITDLIFTPHFDKNGKYRKHKKVLAELFDTLQNRLINDNISINLNMGNELFIHHDLPDLLKNDEIYSLAQSKYVLVEFDFENYPLENDEILYNLKTEGYRVIIAHPERYGYVKDDPNFCQRWLNEGFLLQINQHSLVSDNNKLVLKMIENDFVSFIASDAHNNSRPLTLKKAFLIVENTFGKEKAKALFIDNPRAVLANLDILTNNYVAFKKKLFNWYI